MSAKRSAQAPSASSAAAAGAVVENGKQSTAAAVASTSRIRQAQQQHGRTNSSGVASSVKAGPTRAAAADNGVRRASTSVSPVATTSRAEGIAARAAAPATRSTMEMRRQAHGRANSASAGMSASATRTPGTGVASRRDPSGTKPEPSPVRSPTTGTAAKRASTGSVSSAASSSSSPSATNKGTVASSLLRRATTSTTAARTKAASGSAPTTPATARPGTAAHRPSASVGSIPAARGTTGSTTAAERRSPARMSPGQEAPGRTVAANRAASGSPVARIRAPGSVGSSASASAPSSSSKSKPTTVLKHALGIGRRNGTGAKGSAPPSREASEESQPPQAVAEEAHDLHESEASRVLEAESSSEAQSAIVAGAQQRDESPGRISLGGEEKKRWSAWTGDTAVHSDHQPSSSGEDHTAVGSAASTSPPAVVTKPLAAARKPKPLSKPVSSGDSSPVPLVPFLQNRRRSSLMTLELSPSSTNVPTSSSTGFGSPPVPPLSLPAQRHEENHLVPEEDEEGEDDEEELDPEQQAKLDAMLQQTMQALEASHALLYATLSSKHELARIRAFERAVNTSMDQREASLHIRIQGNKQTLEWMGKASKDLDGVLEQMKKGNAGVKTAESALNATSSGSAGRSFGAMSLLRSMSEWPSSGLSSLQQQAQAQPTPPRSPVMTVGKHWRKPSYSGPMVSPSVGDAESLFGIVEARDENATIGKSAAKRLEKALQRSMPTLEDSDETANAPASAEGEMADKTGSSASTAVTEAPSSRSTSVTSPQLSDLSAQCEISPSPQTVALPAMLTNASLPVGSIGKPPSKPQWGTHRRVSSQLIGAGKSGSSFLTSAASTGLTVDQEGALSTPSTMPSPNASSVGDASPWETRSPAPSLSRGRMTSVEALQQAYGMSRGPSSIAPSEAGTDAIPPSVAEEDEGEGHTTSAQDGLGVYDDEDRDSIAESTTSGVMSASGRRSSKRVSAMSLKSPSLTTKAEGHRSTASLSLMDGEGNEAMSSVLNDGGTATATVVPVAGREGSRRDSRLGALAALQKLNASSHLSSSPASATSAPINTGWSSYVPSWLSGNQQNGSPQANGQPRSHPSQSDAQAGDTTLVGDATISPVLARKMSGLSSGSAQKRASLASLGSLGSRSELL